MGYKNLSLNLQEYKLGFIQENIEMVAYTLVCFFVPFMLAHPQFLVGTMVNAALILGALNVRTYKLLPIIIMPSAGVMTAGMIFGQFNVFMLYMMPFIWAGNFVLVYAFKRLNLLKKINKWIVLGIGASAKTIFLFSIAFVLVKSAVLPAVFLTAMGLLQLYTAISGGIAAFGIQYFKKRYFKTLQ